MAYPLYQIVRQYWDESHTDHLKIVRTGLSKELAQEHCGRSDTREISGDGLTVWFDGYEPQTPMLTYRATVHEIPTLFKFTGGCYIDVMPLGECVDAINIQGRSMRNEADLKRECEAFIAELSPRDWLGGHCWHLIQGASVRWQRPRAPCPTCRRDPCDCVSRRRDR